MDSSNAALASAEADVTAPAAVMRGTARGLEWNVDGRAATDAIVAALEAKLAEAPGFFRGSAVRIAVDCGPLANACLVQLAELAGRFELRIVEIGAPRPPAVVVDSGPVTLLNLAEGSAPNPFDDEAPTQFAVAPVAAAPDAGPSAGEPVQGPAAAAAPDALEAGEAGEAGEDFDAPTRVATPLPAVAAAILPALAEGTRLVVGPVRSGVILDHPGHLIVFGDVNPGAEVRATGNIVVLGRLRGTAHAAIGSDTGFILALRLSPQQLRIGRRVARAADNDTSSSDAEIAYATGTEMIVERYQGRLPRNLADRI